MIDNVLIVSSREQSIPSFISLLRSEGCRSVGAVKNAAQAKMACSDREFSVIIINTPLSDEFGDSLAFDLLRSTGSSVMLIVKNELEHKIEQKLLPCGGYVIGKPLDKTVLHKALNFIEASANRMISLQKENYKLHKKVEDSRIINRAKCILMEYLSMSESQAHRYIEKQAMDLRLTKVEVAKNLLSTYDS